VGSDETLNCDKVSSDPTYSSYSTPLIRPHLFDPTYSRYFDVATATIKAFMALNSSWFAYQMSKPQLMP